MSAPKAGKATDKNVLTTPRSKRVPDGRAPASKTDRTDEQLTDDQLDSVAGGRSPSPPAGPVPPPYPNRRER